MGSSINDGLEKLATHVVPIIIDFGKATFLMESMTLVVHFKARDKFNMSLLIAGIAVLALSNAQPQPTLSFIKLHAIGPRCGVPGGEEIALVTINKTTVA